MPNWCDNSTRFYHPDSTKIDALVALISNPDPTVDIELFAHLRPRPLEQEENWYNWNVENWGTKWDADVFSYDRFDANNINIYFNTAWAPPIALYQYLVHEGWQIEALYSEPGMAMIGRFVDGEDEYYEYDLNDKETIEALPKELVEWADLWTVYDDFNSNN